MADRLIRTGRSSGFTLIELLVVVAVLGLLAGLLAGRGPPRSPAVEVRAAAAAVAQGLRSARGQAIAASAPVTVWFDVGGRSLRVGTAAVQVLPGAASLVAGDGAIVFYPDGSASGGRVEIALRERRVGVGVDWVSGRVSVIGDER